MLQVLVLLDLVLPLVPDRRLLEAEEHTISVVLNAILVHFH